MATPVLPHHHTWRCDDSNQVLRCVASAALGLPLRAVAGRARVPPPGVRAWFTAPTAEALCCTQLGGDGEFTLVVVGASTSVKLTVRVQGPRSGYEAGAVTEHTVRADRTWHGTKPAVAGPWPAGSRVLLCTVATVGAGGTGKRCWGVVPVLGVPRTWASGAADDAAIRFAASVAGLAEDVISAPSHAAAPSTLVFWDASGTVLLSTAERGCVVVLFAAAPGVVTLTFAGTRQSSAVRVRTTTRAHPWPQVDAGFGSDNPDGTSLVRDVRFLPSTAVQGDQSGSEWSADGVRTGAPQTASAWSLCDDAAMAVEAHRLRCVRRAKHKRAVQAGADPRRIKRLKARAVQANNMAALPPAVDGCATPGGRMLARCLAELATLQLATHRARELRSVTFSDTEAELYTVRPSADRGGYFLVDDDLVALLTQHPKARSRRCKVVHPVTDALTSALTLLDIFRHLPEGSVYSNPVVIVYWRTGEQDRGCAT